MGISKWRCWPKLSGIKDGVRQLVRNRNGLQITPELADTVDGLLREERNRDDLPLIKERRYRVARN